MFEILTDDERRGQVGIGTLIVFIAMVLVAAIAAGVLINTAGVLQSQASDTGSETQEAVANQVEVVHASGQINMMDDMAAPYDSIDHAGGDVIDVANLTVMKSAGSNAIDLSSMTIQYTSSSTSKTLVHQTGSWDATHTGSAGDWTDGNAHASGANSTQFTTVKLAGDNGDSELINTEDRVEVKLNIAALEAGSDDLSNFEDSGLAGGDSATVALVDQSGAQYTYGISVPSTFGNKQVVEV